MDYNKLITARKAYNAFETADELLAAAVEYFKWAETHPLLEEELFHYKGEVTRASRKRMRPFTKRGLASHLGVPMSRLSGYKTREGEEWGEVVELIEDIIHTQKFDGAAAGLLNASLISRDLGLADKQDFSSSDGTMTAPRTITLVAAKAKARSDEDDGS